MAISEGAPGHLAEHEDIRTKLGQTLTKDSLVVEDSDETSPLRVQQDARHIATFVTAETDADGGVTLYLNGVAL